MANPHRMKSVAVTEPTPHCSLATLLSIQIMSVTEDRPPMPHLARSASHPKPKGILKNFPQGPGLNGVGQYVQDLSRRHSPR